MSNADEILKFKQLLDEQIITEEEFELKKKELLGEKTIETNNNIIKEQSKNYDDKYIEKERKKQKRRNVYRWIWNIIGILIIISGVSELISNRVVSGIIDILIGLIILPLFSEFLWRKFRIGLSTKFKIISCLILVMISGSITAINTNPTTTTNKYETTIVFDTMQFYNNNKSDTITEEELITIKGKPSKIEKWDYEINENTSYPITSYMYVDKSEEYQFYNNKLAVILITKKIQYKSKNSILSMFNLSNKNASKIVDNGTALRYKNCGVNDFWITGFEDKTFDWVKIKFFDIPI